MSLPIRTVSAVSSSELAIRRPATDNFGGATSLVASPLFISARRLLPIAGPAIFYDGFVGCVQPSNLEGSYLS